MSDVTDVDEIKMLLRQMIAGNLTIAYQLEMARRMAHPGEEKVHPMSKVLEVFETLCEVMDPGDDEDEEALDEEEDLPSPPLASASLGELKKTLKDRSFTSTLSYMRHGRKR